MLQLFTFVATSQQTNVVRVFLQERRDRHVGELVG